MAAHHVGTSRRRLFLFRLIAVLAPVVLFLLIEGALSLKFHHEYPGSSLAVQGAYRFLPSQHRGYKNNPGYIRRHDGVVYRYNNLGFRDEDDLDPIKTPGEFRVFITGGSGAYGAGALERGQFQLISGQKTLSSDLTIAAFLEQALQRAMPERRVRVINAAVVNYQVHHCLETYLELIQDLAPDLIVSIDGYNERWEVTNPFTTSHPEAGQGGGVIGKWLRQHSYTMFYLGIAWRNSSLFNQLTGSYKEELTREQLDAMDVRAIREKFARQVDEFDGDPLVMDNILQVYELYAQAARLDGVPILFVVQPVLTHDRTKRLTRIEEDLVRYIDFIDWHRPGIAWLARRLEERAAHDPSFRVFNMLDTFADYEGEAYVDYCHLTPDANRYLAERLAEQILSVPELTTGARPPAPRPYPAQPGGREAWGAAAAAR